MASIQAKTPEEMGWVEDVCFSIPRGLMINFQPSMDKSSWDRLESPALGVPQHHCVRFLTSSGMLSTVVGRPSDAKRQMQTSQCDLAE